MQDKYYIPRTLDEPLKIIVFTIDEWLAAFLPFLLCVFIFNRPLLALLLGLAFLYGIKKLKGEKGPRYIFHLCYWYLPPIIRYKQIPESFKKYFLG